MSRCSSGTPRRACRTSRRPTSPQRACRSTPARAGGLSAPPGCAGAAAVATAHGTTRCLPLPRRRSRPHDATAACAASAATCWRTHLAQTRPLARALLCSCGARCTVRIVQPRPVALEQPQHDRRRLLLGVLPARPLVAHPAHAQQRQVQPRSPDVLARGALGTGEREAHHALKRRLLQLDVEHVELGGDDAQPGLDGAVRRDVGVHEDAILGVRAYLTQHAQVFGQVRQRLAARDGHHRAYLVADNESALVHRKVDLVERLYRDDQSLCVM
eukprot:609695-Prymnesium_polylepis.2